jgi:hypothetical protein
MAAKTPAEVAAEQKVAEEVAAADAKEAEEAKKAEESEEGSEEEEESQEVSSTMVASWSYNAGEEEIYVVFVNGYEEAYSCTPDQWSSAKLAPSAGKWMWENVL